MCNNNDLPEGIHPLSDRKYIGRVSDNTDTYYIENLMLSNMRELVLRQLEGIVEWTTDDIDKVYVVDTAIETKKKKMRTNRELYTGVFPFVYSKASRVPISEDIHGAFTAPLFKGDWNRLYPTELSGDTPIKTHDGTLVYGMGTLCLDVENTLFDRTKSKTTQYMTAWDRVMIGNRPYQIEATMGFIIPRRVLLYLCALHNIEFDLDVVLDWLTLRDTAGYMYRKEKNPGTGKVEIVVYYTSTMTFYSDFSVAPSEDSSGSSSKSWKIMRSIRATINIINVVHLLIASVIPTIDVKESIFDESYIPPAGNPSVPSKPTFQEIKGKVKVFEWIEDRRGKEEDEFDMSILNHLRRVGYTKVQEEVLVDICNNAEDDEIMDNIEIIVNIDGDVVSSFDFILCERMRVIVSDIPVTGAMLGLCVYVNESLYNKHRRHGEGIGAFGASNHIDI